MSQPTEPLPVPALDLKAQYQSIRDEIDAVVRRVIESQHFILGPEVSEFEAEAAAFCGSKHAVGCASGSDALAVLPLMGAGGRAGGRGRHDAQQLLRHRRGRLADRSEAGLRRHRAGHVQHRPGEDRGRDHPTDEGDHPGPPLRPVGRHGPDQRHRREARPPRDRGRRAGDRGRLQGPPRRDARGIRRRSASTRRRTSAASATRGWSPPTTRRWPSRSAGSGSTGWSRSITTTRSASTRGSTPCKRPCSA